MAILKVKSGISLEHTREIKAYRDKSGRFILRNKNSDGSWSRTAMAFNTLSLRDLSISPVRWRPFDDGVFFCYEGDEIAITL